LNLLRQYAESRRRRGDEERATTARDEERARKARDEERARRAEEEGRARQAAKPAEGTGASGWFEDWLWGKTRGLKPQQVAEVRRLVEQYLEVKRARRSALNEALRNGNAGEYRRILHVLLGKAIDDAAARNRKPEAAGRGSQKPEPAARQASLPKVSFKPELAKEIPARKRGVPKGTKPTRKDMPTADGVEVPKARTAARRKAEAGTSNGSVHETRGGWRGRLAAGERTGEGSKGRVDPVRIHEARL
jgi:hypothetical protein